MRGVVTAVTLLMLVNAAPAQEKIADEEAKRAATHLAEQAKTVEGLPLKTDVDVEKSTGIRAGEHGVLFIPNKGLSEETVGKAGKDVTPVGQLWMLRLSPAVNGAPAPNDKLRLVTVKVKDDDKVLVLCLVGVKQGADNKPTLIVYGKDQEPLVSLPLTAAEGSQNLPVELDGKKVDDNSGDLTFRLSGKYRATLRLMAQEE